MNTQPYRVGLLLLGEYPMIAFSMAIEPLRMANRISGRCCYEWQVITPDGMPAMASNGLVLNPDAELSDDLQLDLLLICGGSDIHEVTSAETCVWLRRLALRGPVRSTCGSFARRTAIRLRKSGRGVFAKTFTIACMSCRSICRRFANARMTSL